MVFSSLRKTLLSRVFGHGRHGVVYPVAKKGVCRTCSSVRAPLPLDFPRAILLDTFA